MRWTPVLLLLALLVPVLVVVVDAVRGRRRRLPVPADHPPAPDPMEVVERRLRALEDDVSDLARDVGELRDELYLLQRQMEAGTGPATPSRDAP